MSQRARIPRHIAIIMDGNGRWARQRHLPRLAGHRAGTENIRRIVTECAEQGVQYLTLYAFSTENWSRPSAEVDGLMRILSDFIDRETINLHREGARLRHLGRLDNISAELRQKILDAIELTRHNTRITLAVAFNYGGRADIVDAVRELIALGVNADDVTEKMISDHLSTRGMPDPDLIIRTSGEWRLSNFLIWQAAYSEYWTTSVYWPDFSPEHLRQAIHDYGQRQRRFGGLSEES
ncbi:isoprenyl transferase [Roseiflexus castenholzii]|uniref:Isoprenyl transferase n=1 Tax=Roseiflexus castenholzii (strain DSM 13941 / HLO8) TaxID=383372 RepID=A7NQW6_ROSCS|nr:isoprenyl transferase [Roseiflexus castenholzii]ABU59962.1 undecaprenyl diphosphate synthase [Roseiflexus castenholzii DSM 13941]